MSKIGIKPEDKNIMKAVTRLQRMLDDLTREMESVKSRVTELEK